MNKMVTEKNIFSAIQKKVEEVGRGCGIVLKTNSKQFTELQQNYATAPPTGSTQL